MTAEQRLLQKLALLAYWQYVCHDDFNPEEDFTEDEYWEDLHEQSQEEIQQQVDEEFVENQDLKDVLVNGLGSYLSPKYFNMIPR